MYPISPLFADFLKKHDREFNVKAIIDNVEYDNTKVVDFTIENSLSLTDGFQIGTAIPSKLIIKIRAFDEIPSNARIVPYLALSTANMTWIEAKYPWQDMNISWDGGITDWLPLGEFFVDSREKINDVWTYTCYDKLVFADQAYVSQLSYPTTQKAVWDEIMGRLGWTYDSSVVINTSYQIQAGPAGYTMRQVLAYIAGANCASIYIDNAGMLKFKRFSNHDSPVFEMTTADYVRVKQTNPNKTYTRVVVTYNTEDQLTYEAGTGDENHTLYLENPFATQVMTNFLLASLNGFTYLPITMDARGFPHLDQGDCIVFEQQEGTAWMETATAWQDMNIPWDGIVRYKTVILHQAFSFKGGLKMTLEAPSVSEQQSEFYVDGTLTTAVNKLNQNAVKYGKPYYGITHSRTEGFVVEREDHLSKLTLNSDVMDWKVENQSVLYLDALAKKLKFAGDLEAASGTFSGSLQAASGTFTGDLVAAGGTFSGDLSAVGGTFTGTLVGVDGTFSGTISASTITGGQINGATITGAQIQTSAPGTYPRAEMSNTNKMFKVESSSSNSIEMRSLGSPTTIPDIQFKTGSATASISLPGSSTGLYLGGTRLTMEIDDIYLRGYNGVHVINWSSLKNDQTGSNLEGELNNLATNMTFDPITRNLKLWGRDGDLLAQVNIP